MSNSTQRPDTLYFSPPLAPSMVENRRMLFISFHGLDVGCNCAKCPNVTTCLYSYDTYNTDTDCLADK